MNIQKTSIAFAAINLTIGVVVLGRPYPKRVSEEKFLLKLPI